MHLDDSEASVTSQLLDQEAASDMRSPYQCDGRVYCSQMTSCEEAEFFLANCLLESICWDGSCVRPSIPPDVKWLAEP